MKKCFLIKYIVESQSGLILKEGKIKVKNKISSFEAQCSLEEYLKKQYPTFGALIIKSCKEDTDLNSIFGNIFGSSNPFNF